MVEVLAATLVFAILAVLIFKGVPFLWNRAEGVKCAENMRSLHVSLAAYVHDVGHWPQEPESVQLSENDDLYEDWWIETLKPFGATEKVWQCPSIQRQVVKKSKDGRPKLHYTPTPFDALPFTPYKWSTQPWLAEIGNMHGGGALLCFPDGSIRSMDDVVR